MVTLKNIKVLNELLTRHGQGNSLAEKRKVFKIKGLDKRMGKYSGTPNQVHALMKSLKKNPPVNLGYTSPDPLEQASIEKHNPPANFGYTSPDPLEQQGIQEQKTKPLVAAPNLGYTSPDTQEQAGIDEHQAQAVRDTITKNTKIAQSAASAVQQPTTPTGLTEEQALKIQAEQAPPPTPTPTPTDYGKFDLTKLPTVEQPSEADILARARGATSTQFAETERDIEKARLSAALPGKLDAIRAKFASRGLFFSGARTLEEVSERNQALSDELDIDLRFAKILGNAIDKAKTDLGKEIEEVIDGAKDKRKEEVAFLKSVGLAVDPRTGELYPTLAAVKEERAVRAEGIAMRRLELAEQANIRAEKASIRADKNSSSFVTRTIGDRVIRFQFDVDGNVVSRTDLGASGADGFTRGEKNALAFDNIATAASRELEAKVGTDGYFNPEIYMQYRKAISLQAPTFLDDYDKKFAVDLNPVDAKRLGISQEDLDMIDIIRRQAGLTN